MRAMRWTVLTALCALLPACVVPCPDEPLARPSEPPAFVVRLHDRLTPPEPGVPGVDRILPPIGAGEYALHALYAADGRPIAERWLDTVTVWEGATGVVDAASVLPARMRPGALTLLLADGPRARVRFETSSGLLLGQRDTWGATPAAGGELVAQIDLGDGTVLLSRRRTDASPAGVLWIDADERDGEPRDVFALDGLSSGRVTPGRGAPAGVGRAILTVGLEDEPAAGAVALITPGDDDLSRFELPGVSGCVDAAPLAPAGDVARVAVLCVGDPSSAARDGAGLVLLEAAPALPPRVAVTRAQAELFVDHPPTGALVALAGSWVAYLSAGDEERADALIAVDLTSDAGAILWEEDRSERWGGALGEGDFAPGTGELWWPSVEEGVLRFQQVGEGADARFDVLAAAPPPGCTNLPARQARHLPAP